MEHHTIHMGASIEKLWVTRALTTVTGKENVKVTLFTFLFNDSSMYPYIMWIHFITFCVLVFVFYMLVTFVNGNMK